MVLVALLLLNYAIPIGRIGFESRALESLFYAVLEFSPILCAGLLFGSAIKRSTSVARDYGTNLLGAMVGGAAEYPSLVTGFRALLRGGALLHRRHRGANHGRKAAKWIGLWLCNVVYLTAASGLLAAAVLRAARPS